jgi:hypothetical protein
MYATYHMDCGGCAWVHTGHLFFICPAEGVSELWVESHFLFSLIGRCIVTVDSALPHGAERPACACVPRPHFGSPRSQSLSFLIARGPTPLKLVGHRQPPLR